MFLHLKSQNIREEVLENGPTHEFDHAVNNTT